MDASLYLPARLLHLIGVILWIGGTVGIALVAAGVTESVRQQAAASARATALRVVTPAMVVAWVGGLAVLVPVWGSIYMRAGWMHGKLTLALVVTGLTGMLTGHLRKAATGKAELKPGRVRGIAWTVLALSALVAALAILEPG